MRHEDGVGTVEVAAHPAFNLNTVYYSLDFSGPLDCLRKATGLSPSCHGAKENGKA